MVAKSGVLIIGVLAVVACGGNGTTSNSGDTGGPDAPTETTPAPASSEPAAAEGGDAAPATFAMASLSEGSAVVANALVASFGGDEGFVALVSALERGYGIDQISPAVLEGRLSTDGSITAGDGDLEEPAGVALGVVVLPGSGSGGSDQESVGTGNEVGPRGVRATPSRARGAPFEPLGLLAQLGNELGDSIEPGEDPGAVLIGIIVELSNNGYGLDQIVDALVLGDAILVRIGDCTALSRGIGLTVPPSMRTKGDCSSRLLDQTALEESADDTAGGSDPAVTEAPPVTEAASALIARYDGAVELVQCGLSCGFRCAVPATISVGFNPDGTVGGGFDGQATWTSDSCGAPLFGTNPVEGFWEEDGTFAFASPNVFGITVEGLVIDGVMTASLVESGFAENTPADGTGTVVTFEVQAFKVDAD